ncbi:MAG: hypothetical protein JNM96_03645, partial [Bacteroidia bacterium]|nr:hypothetical protein [Bacteroidia bacterium]
MEKRKIIENRLDLTKEEVLAGMNFNAIKQNKLKNKFSIKSTVFVSAVLIILTVGLVIQFKPKRKPEQIIKTNLVTDSIDGALPIIENRVAKPAAMKEDNNKEVKSINNQTQTLTVTNQEAEENGYSDLDDPLLSKIVSFRERANSDVRYSIEIKDSIYGPTNVSKGYGDIKEYEDKS